MKFLILLTLIGCSPKYDGELAANMYASGARNYCGIMHPDTVENPNSSAVCENVYWNFYCNSNIGSPDRQRCEWAKSVLIMGEE